MAIIFKDRVAENSSTTGLSDFDLDGEVSGCQSFDDAYADTETFIYTASFGNEWEVGLGTFDAANNRVLRTTIRASSNAGAKVNFSAGVKEIAVVDDAKFLNDLNQLLLLANREARSSNTILGIADKAKLIQFTSGSFTQTFTAAATLGAGWFIYLYNSGSGDVTLDPNSSEQIDGLTSFVMYPGEARLITCDGSAFHSLVLKPFYRVWTATAAGGFVKPPGYQRFEGLLWGGGGGGASSTTATIGGGGGGGACVPLNFPASALSATENVTIGAAAAAVTAADGNNGNNSTFAGVTAFAGAAGDQTTGGGGGGGALGAGSGTAGGAPTHDASTAGLSNSGFGGGNSSTGTGNGGNSAWGGGAGGSATGDGGKSIYGGGGGGNPAGTSLFGGAGGLNTGGGGGDGTAPGGGGGATNNSGTSGAGARGELRLWGVA